MGTNLTTSSSDVGLARRPFRKFGGLIVSLLLAVGVGTATADETSPQIWLDYNPLHRLSPKVDLFGDAGIRWDTENDGWWRFVLRPSVGVRAGQVYLTAGVGNFFTFSPHIATHWEIRPFQGASVVWPGGRLAFQHYLRLEERFDYNTETWNSFNSLRLRYQLQVSYRWATYQGGRTWKATASVEPFITLAGEQGLQQEQVRATIGIERTFARDRRLEFLISWQQESLLFLPDEDESDIFLRVRWFVPW